MKFQLISDIHLEMKPFVLEKNEDADYLILAGDIGDPVSLDYKKLIENAASLYKYVFIIKGNHECYGFTLQKTGEKISHVIANLANVFYLNRKTVDIEDDIRVLGTTLWSDISECQRSDIGIFLADFRCIKDWNIENNNHEHFKDVKFIKNEIQRALEDNKKLLIITHHAPIINGASRNEHIGSPLSSAFCTDLKKLFIKPVITWVFGHTHHSCNLIINDIPLLSNQRGYGEEGNTGFDPLFSFDII